MDQYLTTADVAEQLRTPVATVRYWRSAGSGPPSAKIGKRVLYSQSDLDAWVKAKFTAQKRTVC
jgi:excisionase family DNA binding protein